MYDTDELRQHLRECMVEEPISVRELATHIGLTANTLHAFIRGSLPPQMKTLMKIAKYIKKFNEGAYGSIGAAH